MTLLKQLIGYVRHLQSEDGDCGHRQSFLVSSLLCWCLVFRDVVLQEWGPPKWYLVLHSSTELIFKTQVKHCDSFFPLGVFEVRRINLSGIIMACKKYMQLCLYLTVYKHCGFCMTVLMFCCMKIHLIDKFLDSVLGCLCVFAMATLGCFMR